jgi:poly(3-hydroxybutyrate) depolymerase
MIKKIMILLISFLLLVTLFSGCITTQRSIVHDGRTRYYDIHIPPAYNHRFSMPLVICLHYGGGNGEIIEEVTMLSEKADEEGFIVVYPYGTGVFNKKLRLFSVFG